MNKIYRLVWSHVAMAFVPVAEFSVGKSGKSPRAGRRKLLLSGILLAGSLSGQAMAVDVQWTNVKASYGFPTDPSHNYDQVESTGYSFTVGGPGGLESYDPGTTLNILGAIPQLPAITSSGVTGSNVPIVVALPQVGGPQENRITSITATDEQGNSVPITVSNINEYTYSPSPAIPQQNQELNLEVPGLEGSFQVISVYDSSTFATAEDVPLNGMALPIYNPNSARIMYQFGIVNVDSSGGTANVNIGADTAGSTPIAAAVNTLDLLTKDSTLARADGGATGSDVNWLSDNYIHFRPAIVLSNDTQNVRVQSTQYNYSLTLPHYAEVAGRVVQLADQTFTINSPGDISAVNDFLLGKGDYAGKTQIQYWLDGGEQVQGEIIDSAVKAQAVYNAIITQLLNQAQSTTIDVSYHIWSDMASHNNNATLGTGDLRVIYANGNTATGTVTASGSLAVDGASAVMEALDGTITNNGAINAWRSSGNSPLSVAMRATDGTSINNGVLNAGLFLEKMASIRTLTMPVRRVWLTLAGR